MKAEVLVDERLSVSAVWGRAFRVGEKTYGHIIDPRTGAPAENALLSAVALPSATESDALSTALLTAPELMATLVARRPELRCVVATGTEKTPCISAHGITLAESF